MWESFFVGACAVAGLAVLWRNWLSQHPGWVRALGKLPRHIEKPITCGSCFTFWVALAYCLVFDPVPDSIIQLRGTTSNALVTLLEGVVEFLALGMIAVLLRFAFVLVQEQLNKLNACPHHAAEAKDDLHDQTH